MKRWQLPFLLGLFVFEAALLLIIIQYLQLGNLSGAISWALFHKKLYLFSVLLLMIFGWGLTSIINRLWVSNSLFIDICLIFGLINNQKMTFRQEPVLSSDLTMVSNTGQLASMISFKNIIAVIVLCSIIVALNYFGFKQLNFPKHCLKIPARLVGLFAMALMILSFFRVNHPNSLSAKIYTKFGDTSYTWSLDEAANNNGPLLAFINSIDMTIMDKPKGYSQARILSIVKKYSKTATEINEKRSRANINKQTLIYVLSESFSDPTRVPNLRVNADPIPNIRKIKQKTTSGKMKCPIIVRQIQI